MIVGATSLPPLEKGRSPGEARRVGIMLLAIDPHPNPPLFKGREHTAGVERKTLNRGIRA